MTIQSLESVQNPLIKRWKTLKDARGRAEQRAFMAEGEHLAGEALHAGKASVLLVTEDMAERFAEYVRLAERQKIPVYMLSSRAMEAVCDAKTPQGIAAVCEFEDTKESFAECRKLAALDGLQDPGNVGTMLRTLDAAGFDGMLVSPKTADPFSPKALRASMGAIFRVPVYAVNLPEALGKLLSTHDLYAGALDGKPFYERKRQHEGVCVIVGNEGAGISDEVYAVQGIQRVKLPMVGGAESLNAAVAGAIMIYDIVRLGE